MIITPRLALIPATVALLEAELRSKEEIEPLLGARVPDSWPPQFYDQAAVRFALRAIQNSPGSEAWWFHYFVLRGSAGDTLVGAGGYKGPPADAVVEIGYSILPDYQRRGFASEAAGGLIAHAFSHAAVERVRAETLPELTASIGVLRTCRFALVGPGSEPGVVRYELTRRAWLGSAELSPA
jgi:RimJ/RimL family protein N-acetyltransferase